MRTRNIFIISVLAMAIGIIVFGLYQLRVPSNSQSAIRGKHSTDNQKPKVVVYQVKDSTTHARVEAMKPAQKQRKSDPIEIVSKEYETYVKDTLAVALNVAVNKINELTRVKAKLEGELKATKIELAENKEKRVYYEDKYISIITQEDSTGTPKKLQYAYNAELNIANFSQRKNFWNKERYYIDVSSPDKNFKIYGLEHYKKEIYIRPKSIGIGLQFGYGITDDFRISPYMGVGVSYNLIRF